MKKIKKTVIATVLLGVVVAFIWGNSLVPGIKSGEISDGFTAFLARLFGVESADFGHIVRKCAHFSEFAVLGLLLFTLLRWRGKSGRDFFLPLALCMMAFPLIDETIQLFTPDRGSSVTDIWIDMAGYAVGSFAAWLIHKILESRRKKKAKKAAAEAQETEKAQV